PRWAQHLCAGGRAAGEPGLRDGASELCDEQQLCEPDAGATGPLGEEGQLQDRRVCAAEAAGRRGCTAASGEDRGEADYAFAEAGRLSGRAGGRALQGGELPVLTTEIRGQRSGRQSPGCGRGFVVSVKSVCGGRGGGKAA